MIVRRALPYLAIAITLVGLVASAAALADSLAPAPAWCSAGGCKVIHDPTSSAPPPAEP
jgi:hypothetical protein